MFVLSSRLITLVELLQDSSGGLLWQITLGVTLRITLRDYSRVTLADYSGSYSRIALSQVVPFIINK